ncbi:glycosyltransferase family 2 protein [Patescibacteria group bacterium]|nr:glycosyltransferase family 2 protein [Patescibacteria group bacterium]
MNKNRSSIIIPNWNGEKLLRKNLPRVLDAVDDAEVIVVDDASTDRSVNFIKKTYSQVRLAVHRKNRGFAATCNHGVNLAKGEIVVLLNTDVVPQRGFLEPILEDFLDTKVFAVGCGEVDSGPGWAVFKNGAVELVRKKRLKKKSSAFWASGGQSAFSREKWLALGGFDYLYQPFYLEDVDLCYRAWKRGFEILWDPRSIVRHKHRGVIKTRFSKKSIVLVTERNHLLFIWKNITAPEMIVTHKTWLKKRLLTEPGYWRPFLAALIKLPLVLPRRLKERKESKISDAKIFEIFQ